MPLRLLEERYCILHARFAASFICKMSFFRNSVNFARSSFRLSLEESFLSKLKVCFRLDFLGFLTSHEVFAPLKIAYLIGLKAI